MKEVIVKFQTAICLPPSGITFNILLWICWTIWPAQNTLVFEDRAISPEETALNGIRLEKEWSEAQGKYPETSKIPSDPRASIGQSSRSEEVFRSITCKTDAAWNSDKKTVGLGWDFSGPPLAAPSQVSVIQTFVNSPLFAWR